ncbi:SDR family NAD(P)-dependent oxidoreductase, partial [Planctomycetota bacterium]|nr:SDR family NAD(P)-dependent oxidoreductase [Planctomycetota bacterium]
MKRPIALITGASSGIGLSFSRELATRGYDLILVARREERLKSVAADLSHQYGVECRIEVVDLANPDAVKPLVDRLLSDGLEIEVLINNAGYGLSGSFLSRDWEEHE